MDDNFKRNAIMIVVAILCLWVGSWMGGNGVRNEAIERGYGQLCLRDGAFAWVGECGK
jgi:hypothetical protein